jgi:hypothetical protein
MEQLGNKILLFLPRFTLPTNLRATESSVSYGRGGGDRTRDPRRELPNSPNRLFSSVVSCRIFWKSLSVWTDP